MAAVGGGFQQQPFRRGDIPISVVEPPRAVSVQMAAIPGRGPERPSSALARGIQITEFKEARVNPEPLLLEESELLLEEYLSPRKLRALTGIDDLHEVRYLEMKVDTQDTSLGNFGTHLPRLSQLKLSNSIITTVRDLGSSLNNLRVLWMARCGVEELDGLSSMNSLSELYLAYNDVCDISPCSLLENLTILDLEGNNIDEITQVHFLNSCKRLKNLTLEGNPICVTPSPDEASPDYVYRLAVRDAIPHLETLDDELLLAGGAEMRRTASVFEDDWALIDELLRDGTVAGSEESLDESPVTSQVSRPLSSLRPTTGYRPGSALKNYSGTGIRPGTRSGRPGTSSLRPGTSSVRPGTGGRPGSRSERPGSAGRPSSGEDADSTEDASDLTRGGVVCGNPSKALRSRQNPGKQQQKTAAKLKNQMKFVPEKSYETPDDEPVMQELLEELKEWKQAYHIKQKRIDDSKVPQVLMIDHDDAVSLSGDESVDSDTDEGVVSSSSGRHADGVETTYSINNNHEMGAYGESTHSPREEYQSSQRSAWKKRSRSRGRYDESFEAPEEAGAPRTPDDRVDSARRIHHPHPPPLRAPEELRPLSNPVIAQKGRFKTDPAVVKSSPKTIDPLNPIVRASIRSPEGFVRNGPRADTARVALGQPPLPKSRLGKGLSNVPILPSKFSSK